MFGGLHSRVGQDVAHSKADLDVQAQLTSLVEDNGELRRMYKHLENQLAIASEELKCTALPPLTPPTPPNSCHYGEMLHSSQITSLLVAFSFTTIFRG